MALIVIYIIIFQSNELVFTTLTNYLLRIFKCIFKVYMMVMLILNKWLIKVIEPHCEKISFCKFFTVQKGFHHCNVNFCSKIFVFDIEVSSCSYIWSGSVHFSKIVVTVRQITKKMCCFCCAIKSIQNLLLMIWELFWNISLYYEE